MNARMVTLVLLCSAAPAFADPDGTVRMGIAAYEDLKARAAAGEVQLQAGAEEDAMGAQRLPQVVEARLLGTLNKRVLNLEVKALLEGTSEGWHTFPLVPSDLPITDVTITGGGTLILQDGMRALAFRGRGRHGVSLKLQSAGGESGSSRSLDLHVLPGASRQLSLELAGHLDAEVDPSALITLDRSGGKRILKGFIPASQENISIRWNTDVTRDDPAEEEARPKAPASKEPPRINVQTSMLASVGERLLTVYTTFRYAIFHAPVSRFEWTVPAGVEVIGVQGRGVNDWSCSSGAGERSCFVELPFPVQRTYELSVQIEQPLPKDANHVLIPAPTARGVQRQSGHVAVEVMGNAEVKPGEGTTAVREDVRELPPDLFAGQSTPILLAFKFLEAPVKAVLDIQRRDSVEMSPISVDDASFTTVWTSEGRTITEGTFHIRNRQRQFLALRLPADAIIQSAFVADAPVKPSTGEDGRIRIPLRNNGRSGDAESFVVQVVYILDNQPLPSLGGVTAALPALDSEIGALHHTLVLPDHQLLWAFGGDLSIERPHVEQEATHRGRGGFPILGGAAMRNEEGGEQFANMAPPPPPAQQEVRADLLKNKDARHTLQRAQAPRKVRANVAMRSVGSGGAFALEEAAAPELDMEPPPVGNTGVLPVRIQIPSSGDRYQAHAFYVPPDKSLTWNARAAGRGLLNGLLFLLALLGVAIGALAWRQRAGLLQRAPLNRETMVLWACVVVSVVLTAYFKRQVVALPGFVLVGLLGAWTLERVRAQEETPAAGAGSA